MSSTAETKRDPGRGWTRVSSSKPYLAWVLLTGMATGCFLVFMPKQQGLYQLAAAGVVVALGLIALNWKVVHRRGTEYRVTTLFYSEVVSVDDVCMMVSNPGWIWMRLQIHLRRPGRCGWMISFVPADERWGKSGGRSG